MNVTVIGGGIMGSGIAQLAAMHGHQVVLCDVEDSAIDRAWASIDSSLERFQRKGALTEEQVADARTAITSSTELGTAAETAAVAIEAVPEDVDLKVGVWEVLAASAPTSALLATNTSQLSITRLAAAVPAAASRFIGMHFFNPPVMMRLVEIVRGLRTNDEAEAQAIAFAESLDRVPVVCRKDSPGFLTTRAYAALRMECLRMLEEGLASAEDIDTALKLAFNLPMGPLELADFNGLDTVLSAYEALAESHGERFRPTTTLRNTVAAGRLGRKSGHGFFRYEDAS